MKNARTLIAAVALVAPLLASAQNASSQRVAERQLNQGNRIQQGKKIAHQGHQHRHDGRNGGDRQL